MSLLSFVMPSIFHQFLQPLQRAFSRRQHLGEGGGYYQEQVARAKEIMRPFILRRLKSEVRREGGGREGGREVGGREGGREGGR